MNRAVLLVLLLFAPPVLAGQASPREQALSERLVIEVSANVEARARVIELQAALVAAQAKIKELEKIKPEHQSHDPE
jgi:hypothetical protein